MFVNLNGRLLQAAEATLLHDNRAFRYGFGLFETMLFRDGVIELAPYHWERLFPGLKTLQLTIPGLWNAAFLEREVVKTVRKNKLEQLCRIRLQVWPGNGGLYDGKEQLSFLVECFPLEPAVAALNENGLVVGLAEDIYKSCDRLSALKSANSLIYAVAARQAKAAHWNDALILNAYGRIAETTIANIFWVKDTRLFTPPLTEGCVNGVMRRHLSHTASLKGFLISEAPLTTAEMLEADEIFITNAIRKIKWVRRFQEKSYGNGLTRELAFLLENKA